MKPPLRLVFDRSMLAHAEGEMLAPARGVDLCRAMRFVADFTKGLAMRAGRFTFPMMLCGILACVVSGCAKQPNDMAGSDTPQVVEVLVTTGMVRDLVDQLLGDGYRVRSIMGPGVDPHLYQPSRSDAVQLLGADLVVYNGLNLEGQLGAVLEGRSKSGKRTIAAAELVAQDRLLAADAGLYDPHVWMDVALWREVAEGLARELSEWKPEDADQIKSSLEELQSRLTRLDQWCEESIATIPESQRVLVTAHDAFRYFGRRYEIEVHGVQGVSTMGEAAISDTNRLVELIVSRKIPAVFFESSVSSRQVSAIVEGARRRGIDVASGVTLYSDSLGAEASSAGTYIGMIEHNVRGIVTGLGGTAGELGIEEDNDAQVMQPETPPHEEAPR